MVPRPLVWIFVSITLASSVAAQESPAGEPLDVVFISAEVRPFLNPGGLSGVSQDLPAALTRLGHRVTIITPLYHLIDPAKHALKDTGVTFQVGSETVRLWKGATHGVDVYFLDNARFFSAPRDGTLYVDAAGRDYPDSPARYDFFSRASLAATQALDLRPNVIHANDHHTGAVTWYAKQDAYFALALKVYEIHNAAYQGMFDPARLRETGLEPAYRSGAAEFFGRVNPMKLGIESADLVMTVSPTYAQEIQGWRFGAGMEGALQRRAKEGRLVGILNGIDTNTWNPADDPHIRQNYDEATLERKAANTAELQKTYFGAADPRVPVVATVARLTEQKGIDEILYAVERLAASGRKFQYVITGLPDTVYAKKLEDLNRRYPDKIVYDPQFSSAKEHRIYAGAHFFLMPSRWEPSGLPQMQAMRYGTVPVVSRVGGLVDSVIEYDPQTRRGTGFTFGARFPDTYWGMPADTYERVIKEYEQARLEATRGGLERALDAYENRPDDYRRMQINGMRQDHRWLARAAPAYVAAYRSAMPSAGPALRREAGGWTSFVAAYLLNGAAEAAETRDLGRAGQAFREVGTWRFARDLGVFSIAAGAGQWGIGLIPVAGARTVLSKGGLPLAAGMAATQPLSGRFSGRDWGIDTASFVVAGFGVSLPLDFMMRTLVRRTPQGWWYSTIKSALVLYAGGKLGDRLKRREGVSQRIGGISAQFPEESERNVE